MIKVDNSTFLKERRDKMSNVYFKKIDNLDDSINDVVYNMLKKVIEKENVVLNDVVPLKVHFGEKGNDTFIKPNYFNGIKKYLKENNKKSLYIETNVLYKGSRTLTKDHLETAKEHGFTDLDIIIADGEEENMYNEIEVNLKNFKSCKIGYKFSEYSNYIVISHFKGHAMAGFGGAIKQLAMGFASRGGKLHQHSQSIPIINKDKCIGCGRCVRTCPVNAISLVDNKAVINKLCVGCASCSAVCPVGAITNSWQASNFHEKLAEYAYAASLNKTNVYVQYAFDITEYCDCDGHHMEKIAPNIGLLISTDPVSLDKATYDLFKQQSSIDTFDKAMITLNHAKDIGLGELEYNLIEE